MVRTGETQKDVLVTEAARLAGKTEADGTAVEPFVRAFYEHVPPADVVSRAASDLADAALSIWRLAADRPAGRPKIRILSPSAGEAWVGERSIVGLRRVSKPGLRVYAKSTNLPRVLGGLGVAIISTSSGLLTDRQAARQGVGGEVLAYVW